MAKLTRTQKYAGLRETLANDSESSLSTKELSNYEDRLNNITSQLGPADVRPDVGIQETTPIEQLVQSFKDEEKTRNEEPVKVQPVNTSEPVFERAIEEFNSILQEDIHPVNTQKQEANVPYDKVEVSPVGPMEIKEPAPEKEIAEFEDEKPEYMGLYQNPDAGKRTAYSSLEEQIRTGIVDQSTLSTPVIDPNHPEWGQNATQPPVVEAKKPTIMEEPADNHVIDHSNDVKNTFINDVMNEVDMHIKQSGQQTVTQLTNEMVNEVRRADNAAPVQNTVQQPRPAAPVQTAPAAPVRETVVQPQPAPVRHEVTDEEFSNTVSMEIGKIMDEVIADDKHPQPARPEPVREEPKTEPHPVLTKALEEEKEEDIVEIKNISDIDINDTPSREATTGTIPFVVTANDELMDDDEEEGSNTVLNIILIILIVILVAVLGLIVFYILKTKGII